MDNESGLKMRKWFFIFALVLIFTNVLNYYFFGYGFPAGLVDDGQKSSEPSSRVIKYEPDRYVYNPDTALIWEAIDLISAKHYNPIELSTLVEGAVRGMIESIDDPYAQFLPPRELDEFMVDTIGTYGGIGVRIIEVEPYIVVFETMTGTPAERSNLTPGDRIISADGQTLIGEGVSRAVELLRGLENTTVEVEIVRPGSDRPITVTVEREQIIVPTVSSELIREGIGYIGISSFESNTAAEFARRLNLLEEQGISKGLIFDLRNNLGGQVDQAIEVSRQLVPEGEIASIIDGDGVVLHTYYSNATAKPYPIVVLINEESASASELVAGALQDRGVALLVGKNSYGKAAVQNLEYLSGNYGISFTVARYFTPSGQDIHEHGIKPNFEVEMSEALRYYRYFFPGRLERGSYGPEVEMLQLILAQVGYDLDESGYFDDKTVEALADFQTSHGLRGSGEFDDQTWLELRVALDRSFREDDEQLNFAVELVSKPGLWTITGGNNQ